MARSEMTKKMHPEMKLAEKKMKHEGVDVKKEKKTMSTPKHSLGKKK